MITASIARDLVLAALGSFGALHGLVVHAPDTAMPSDFLRSLIRHAPTLDDRHDGAFARALIKLLRTALGGPRDVAVEARRQDHLRREAVEQLIEREIDNPNLTGAVIAERVSVSRATLYRLYQRSGGSGGMSAGTASMRASRVGDDESRLWSERARCPTDAPGAGKRHDVCTNDTRVMTY